MSSNHNINLEKEVVELIKTEMGIIFSQMHIRMTHKYTITAIELLSLAHYNIFK